MEAVLPDCNFGYWCFPPRQGLMGSLASPSYPKSTEQLCQGNSGAQICIPFLWFLCQTIEETWVITRLGQMGPGPPSFLNHRYLLQRQWRIDPRVDGITLFLHLSSDQAPRPHLVLSYYWLPGTPIRISNPFISSALWRSALPALFSTFLLYNCLPISLKGFPGFLPILKILDSTILRNTILDHSATTSSLFPSPPSLSRERNLAS